MTDSGSDAGSATRSVDADVAPGFERARGLNPAAQDGVASRRTHTSFPIAASAVFLLGLVTFSAGVWRHWFSSGVSVSGGTDAVATPAGMEHPRALKPAAQERLAEQRVPHPAAGPPVPQDLSALAPDLAESIHAGIEEVRRSPGDPVVHARLGMIYEAHDYRELARTCYARAASLAPENPRWRYLWAVTARKLGDAAGAEDALDEVIRRSPDYAPAHERLGLLLLERGELETAREHFQTVLELQPEQPQGYVHVARVELARDRYGEAVDRLALALAVAPSSAEAHYLLGRAYRGLGEDEEAAAHFAQGRDARVTFLWDPWRAEVARMRTTYAARHEEALLLLKEGKPSQAARLLELTLERSPNNVDLLNSLSVAYLQSRHLRDARRVLERALRVNQEHFATHVNLSTVMLSKGDAEAALRHAELAVRAAPHQPRPFHVKASALSAMARYEEALESFRRAAQLDTFSFGLEMGIGETLVRLGRWEEAAGAFERAVALGPQSVQARYNLGIIYARWGRFGDAARTLRVALELEPENQRVKATLRRCEARLTGD